MGCLHAITQSFAPRSRDTYGRAVYYSHLDQRLIIQTIEPFCPPSDRAVLGTLQSNQKAGFTPRFALTRDQPTFASRVALGRLH